MARVERSPKIILRFERAHATSGATLSPILGKRATEAIFTSVRCPVLVDRTFF